MLIENLKQVMEKFYTKKVWVLSTVFILLIALCLAVFFGNSNYRGDRNFVGSISPMAPAYYGDIYMEEGSGYAQGKNVGISKVDTKGGNQGSLSDTDRKIVKNASLDILVKKIEDTAEKIRVLVGQYNGVVDSSNVSSQGIDTKYGTMVIRVPNEQFDLVVREIGSLAVKVNSEQVTSDDVTLRYVDLEARLKSKKAVEEQYVALLQKANKVEEIVAVHAYLDRVREDIEVTQAQLNYLSNQVSMSSISISMTSEAEVKILGITWHPITTIKQSFRNALKDVADVIDWFIRFVFALPGIILQILVVVGVVWVLIKGVKKVSVLFKKDTL